MFQNSSYLGTYVYAKGNTRTQRETEAKSAKHICLIYTPLWIQLNDLRSDTVERTHSELNGKSRHEAACSVPSARHVYNQEQGRDSHLTRDDPKFTIVLALRSSHQNLIVTSSGAEIQK